MSNGLADASFFPTAKELSTGLRWFKDHPVLAAAAATAVSVITYLNATDALAATDELSDDLDDDDSNTGIGNELDSSDPVYYYSSTSSSNGRRHIEEQPDEKLSAAVSWCDEHGGSLTQVFEHLRLVGEHSEESDEEPTRHAQRAPDALRRSGAPAEGRICDSSRPLERPVGVGGAVSGIRKSSTQQSILSVVGSPDVFSRERSAAAHRLQALRDDEGHVASSSPGEVDLQTESPQWGWYVAITPPQDHVQHANLPRAALLPPHRPQQQQQQQQPHPPTHAGIARPSYVSAPTASLRRTASGRIS
ncbi:hypothetical protein PybrP1_005802 [[Pythium] brassicae (nom. inval.)]|nr:hypothetical protein PybrP1_005802 [[Pythium] brassicae (nom. inval.)]